MGIGKIASFLSSLSPASDAAAAATSVDPVSEEAELRAHGLPEQPGLARDNQNDDPNHIATQLQTMVSAVRTLNDNAVEQGAAVAVSPAGLQLRNAVTALGHLLAAVDSQDLAQGAAGPVREASGVIDAVEAGLGSSRNAATQIMDNLPAHQAFRAQESLDAFQSAMRAAIDHARDALSGLRVGN